jgi:hypothetical protein
VGAEYDSVAVAADCGTPLDFSGFLLGGTMGNKKHHFLMAFFVIAYKWKPSGLPGALCVVMYSFASFERVDNAIHE